MQNTDLHNLSKENVVSLLDATTALLWQYAHTDATSSKYRFHRKSRKNIERITEILGYQKAKFLHFNVYLLGTSIEIQLQPKDENEIVVITIDIRPRPVNQLIVSVDRIVDHQKEAGESSFWYIPSLVSAEEASDLDRKLHVVQQKGRVTYRG